ncbi:MAG: adenosylcobinamide-phosphate synthase CbiB, partial [Mariprofundaceae bacterium]
DEPMPLASLALALLLEWLFGDPPDRWHPVAAFGRWAGWCEAHLWRDARLAGAVAWLVAVAPGLAVAWGLHVMAGWIGDAWLLWASLGWKSLLIHVRAVLNAPDEEAARRAVAGIVSRDADAMTREEANRAALESLAENASDAVVAPLFWFAFAGGIGTAFYRMVNTLDAMWGYRNQRFRRFGWWAARADDAMNLMPARITAMLLLLAGRLRGCGGWDWARLRGQAGSHASPNAGWCEAALAWAADVRLGGPVRRAGVVEDRPWYGADAARAPHGAAARDALAITQAALAMAALGAGIGAAF